MVEFATICDLSYSHIQPHSIFLNLIQAYKYSTICNNMQPDVCNLIQPYRATCTYKNPYATLFSHLITWATIYNYLKSYETIYNHIYMQLYSTICDQMQAYANKWSNI